MRDLARWLIGVVGAGALAFGGFQLHDGHDGAGTISLLAAGLILILVPLVVDRLERLSVTPSGFDFRLTSKIAELGAPRAAGILDRTELPALAESYSLINREVGLSGEAAKVDLQDLLVARAEATARSQKFDRDEVHALFHDGSPVMRVLALGLMEGDPSLADAGSIASAITESRSGNEQYHGLKVARRYWRQLSTAERQSLLSTVSADPEIARSPDRKALAAELGRLPIG